MKICSERRRESWESAAVNKNIAIVGYGRFGALWASLLKPDFSVSIIETGAEAASRARADGFEVSSAESALPSAGAVFYAVPISAFEETIRSHLPYLSTASAPLVIDLLSVKVHPKQVLQRLLSKGSRALLTHPMFGPDSAKVNGFSGLPIVVDRFLASDEDLAKWKGFFKAKGLSIVEMTADEHDKLAARSQGITHFVGRMLGELDFTTTPIDTLGAVKLQEIKSQVCNDSWQLFHDLQSFNPYTVEMRVKLGEAQEKVYNKLLPNRIHSDRLVVGIQGGKGSFNEEAARYYLSRQGIAEFEIVYLHTTKNVLKALHEGSVDRGQFAMHNSIGGIVHESVEAMAEFNFKIVEEFSIKISHTLMIGKDAEFSAVDTIMTHPQVLRQCAKNLQEKYSRLKTTSGEGELIDHAKVAELLGRKELPKNVATMGSKVLAEINDLRIIEENLQDLAQNFTSFLWVERPQ